ncbi:DUF2971 domain-containing protein [Rhizobium leguminosarum]|uniref:DUF2971 domain-containing protein n=1 Tax=Rhizobium leguminosarum TaxID=384 RepID=UPI001C977492|nr:DUF2971 domain-containing protein [Rhizobium leguminosarum]MBY5760939.1 DUF2971 domain-containing protein [Rhizobium leguminosarum]
MYVPNHIYKIFHPHVVEKAAKVDRFAYYTRAETALSVIQNQTLWMRKTKCMNDFRELVFGRECLTDQLAFKRDYFREVIDSFYGGLADELLATFEDDATSMADQTYITCVSEHDATEDAYGRLSMWRAYGGTTGVAIVFKREAAELPGLPYYASPVLYTTSEDFGVEFDKVLSGIASSRNVLRNLPRELFRSEMLFALQSALVSIKHRGFVEEREWRIVYYPNIPSPYELKPQVRVINGVPQIIREIQLKRGMSPLGLTDLIDRVIVGPTQFPDVIAEALTTALSLAGVKSAEDIVHISDIPLRHNV